MQPPKSWSLPAPVATGGTADAADVALLGLFAGLLAALATLTLTAAVAAVGVGDVVGAVRETLTAAVEDDRETLVLRVLETEAAVEHWASYATVFVGSRTMHETHLGNPISTNRKQSEEGGGGKGRANYV